MAKKLINVTQQHIDRGIKADRCNCPVALALKEAFQTENVMVTPGIFVNDIYLSASANIDIKNGLTHTLFESIGLIDRGDTVTPFSFELEYDETVVG